jgi:Gluconate 2-dehydrogenase subunit 3
MNRRKAINRILVFAGGSALLYGGYRAYELEKSPDLSYLERRKGLLTHLADTIIPPTDTPGAAEAGVGEFMVILIRDCTARESQNTFIGGLKELEKYCTHHYGHPFPECSQAQKIAVLDYFENQGKPRPGLLGKAERRYLGMSFFQTLRRAAAIGYCSSQLGATRGLAYDYIPQKYLGCIPLAHGQKAWATK